MAGGATKPGAMLDGFWPSYQLCDKGLNTKNPDLCLLHCDIHVAIKTCQYTYKECWSERQCGSNGQLLCRSSLNDGMPNSMHKSFNQIVNALSSGDCLPRQRDSM